MHPPRCQNQLVRAFAAKISPPGSASTPKYGEQIRNYQEHQSRFSIRPGVDHGHPATPKPVDVPRRDVGTHCRGNGSYLRIEPIDGATGTATVCNDFSIVCCSNLVEWEHAADKILAEHGFS